MVSNTNLRPYNSGADDKGESWEQPGAKLDEGTSPMGSLHEAIDDNDMDELEDLLKWKPNLEEPCKRLGQTYEWTPIQKAAHLGKGRGGKVLGPTWFYFFAQHRKMGDVNGKDRPPGGKPCQL